MGDLPSNCAAQKWKNDHTPLGFGGTQFLGKPSSADGILQDSAGDAGPARDSWGGQTLDVQIPSDASLNRLKRLVQAVLADFLCGQFQSWELVAGGWRAQST